MVLAKLKWRLNVIQIGVVAIFECRNQRTLVEHYQTMLPDNIGGEELRARCEVLNDANSLPDGQLLQVDNDLDLMVLMVFESAQDLQRPMMMESVYFQIFQPVTYLLCLALALIFAKFALFETNRGALFVRCALPH